MGWRFGSVALIAGASLALAGAAPASECAPGPMRVDAVAAVGERGEIRLASGARALLGSIRWPEEAAAERAARAWLAAQAGHPLAVVQRGQTDRWGRARIDASLEDGALDLAGGLVTEGLAAVDAGEVDALCRPALLQAEAAARAAGRGLWGRGPVAASDGPALRAEAGRFVVAEGRLRHVGERSARTYLDFVRRGEDGLTVIVSKRTWRRMREHGLSAEGLTGKLLRVRGVVEVRRGPVIEIAALELIELVDGGGAQAPAGNTDGGRALRR
ncbi:hypothetical protein MTDSW087_01006 [Methylobacterium dankookense]|uniref:TNase-like domain-containing protein n=1 Tax=Methylobacterium dankookense TaxID=560405 RepID=A0A564FT55_9HYPH|nr:hypothetical protein IFDJLNFL_1129 [Methylobacterium dankookense]VUF11325.1 hypothetical protein MTDSW087_01006 [Methylobacterium dankookense]